MYGFSGYGINPYASRRLFGAGIVGPTVKLAMRVLQSGYGLMNVLMLGFKNNI
jgi:hypothetical protein